MATAQSRTTKLTSRACVEHVLRATRSYAPSLPPTVTADAMRRAKLNEDVAAAPLWDLLGALLTRATCSTAAATMAVSPLSRAEIVQALTARGFASLGAAESPPSSRRLLLAAGATLARHRVLERFEAARRRDASATAPLPPYPSTTARLHDDHGASNAAQRRRRPPPSLPHHDDDGSAEALLEATHAVAQLHGRLRMSAQALSLSLDANGRLLGELRGTLAARASNERRTMGTYEAHLLRCHQRAAAGAAASPSPSLLEAHAAAMREAVRARELARGFWRWMDGVLALEQRREGRGGSQLDKRATGNAKERVALARDVYGVVVKKKTKKAKQKPAPNNARARGGGGGSAAPPPATAEERSAAIEALLRVRALRERAAERARGSVGGSSSSGDRRDDAASLAAALWARAMAAADGAADAEVAALQAAATVLPLDVARDDAACDPPPQPPQRVKMPSARALRSAAQALVRSRSEQAERYAARLETALAQVMVETRQDRWAVVGL